MIVNREISRSDIPALTQLWIECFEEKREAAELFFERNMSYTHGCLAQDGGKIIAAVYLISRTLCGGQAHYLCGAATLPQYRGRGVMSSLMRFALRGAAERGDLWSVLLPAGEGLYGFYKRFGYAEGCSECEITLGCGAPGNISEGEPDLERLQAACFKNNFLYWNNDYIRFAEKYYSCYGVSSAKGKNVFALYERSGDYAEVFYAIYNDIKELKSHLSAEGIRRFTLKGAAGSPLFEGCKPEKRGMILPLSDKKPPERTYIGITLS